MSDDERFTVKRIGRSTVYYGIWDSTLDKWVTMSSGEIIKDMCSDFLEDSYLVNVKSDHKRESEEYIHITTFDKMC